MNFQKKIIGINYLQPCFVCHRTGKIDWIFYIKHNDWATGKDVDQGMMHRINRKWWLKTGFLIDNAKDIIKHKKCYYTREELNSFMKTINKTMSYDEIIKYEIENIENLFVYKMAVFGITIGR